MPFFFDHYPYTNFHNVNLDWVLQAVKAWGAMVEQNNQNFINLDQTMSEFRSALEADWTNYQNTINNEYAEWSQNIYTQWVTFWNEVRNYLRDLDVSQEISDKLNEMLNNGDLANIINPTIASTVTQWLSDNITPTTPAIDATLTISGAGADAKSTGNHIRNVENNIVSGFYNFNDVVLTGLTIPAGANPAWASSVRAKSHIFKIPQGINKIKVTANSSQNSIIAFLNSNNPQTGELVDFANGRTGRYIIQAGATNEYYVSTNDRYLYILILDTSKNDHTPTLEMYRLNYYLYPIDIESDDESNKTDMSTEIQLILDMFGKCKLADGIFYIANTINLPERGILEGSGDSIIRPLSNITSISAVKIQKYCIIRNIKFSGSFSAISVSSNGNRNAIEFSANFDGSEGATQSTTQQCMLDNVWIERFKGSGIYCHNSNNSVSQGMLVNNVYIYQCNVGINIDINSEFHKFTNICITSCYIACINNGGNNTFTACTFHATNTGFYVDGTQPNSAHSSLNGCTFCHVGSNNGKAINISDAEAGVIIANCQFWYNSIYINNSSGIILDGCEFGRGITNDGNVSASIYITDGTLVLFNGCSFHKDSERHPKINITNNSKVKFNGCYGAQSGFNIPSAPETLTTHNLSYNSSTGYSWT